MQRNLLTSVVSKNSRLNRLLITSSSNSLVHSSATGSNHSVAFYNNCSRSSSNASINTNGNDNSNIHVKNKKNVMVMASRPFHVTLVERSEEEQKQQEGQKEEQETQHQQQEGEEQETQQQQQEGEEQKEEREEEEEEEREEEEEEEHEEEEAAEHDEEAAEHDETAAATEQEIEIQKLGKKLGQAVRAGKYEYVISTVEAYPDFEQFPLLTARWVSAKVCMKEVDLAVESAFKYSEQHMKEGKKWTLNMNFLLMSLTFNVEKAKKTERSIKHSDFVSFVKRIDNYFHEKNEPRSTALYHALITTSRDLLSVKGLMDEMKEKEITPWNNTKYYASSVYISGSSPELALPLIRDLLSKNIELSPKLYEELFLQALSTPALSSEAELLSKIFLKKVRFHGITSRLGRMYENLMTLQLDGAASVGNYELAENTWKLMAESKIPHQSHHFHAIFEAYASGNQYQAAINTIKEMIARDIPLHIPSLERLSRVIASSVEEIDACYYDINNMIENDNEVPMQALNLVIYACVLARDIDRGFATFAEFDRLKMKPDVNTYTYMIMLCKRQLPTAMKLYEEMRAQGIAPNAITYGAMIQCALGARNIAKALETADSIPPDVKIDPYALFNRMLIIAHKMRRPDYIEKVESLFSKYNRKVPTVNLEEIERRHQGRTRDQSHEEGEEKGSEEQQQYDEEKSEINPEHRQ